MKQTLTKRILNNKIKEQRYFEINLPTYLQTSLDRWKYNEQENLWDCFYDDLYGSINSAEVDDEISKEHAKYLRGRYLGL